MSIQENQTSENKEKNRQKGISFPVILFLLVLITLINTYVFFAESIYQSMIGLHAMAESRFEHMAESLKDASGRSDELDDSYNERYFRKLKYMALIAENESMSASEILSAAGTILNEPQYYLIETETERIHTDSDSALSKETENKVLSLDLNPGDKGILSDEEIRVYYQCLREGLTQLIVREEAERDAFLDNVYSRLKVLQSNSEFGNDYTIAAKDGVIVSSPREQFTGKRVDEVIETWMDTNPFLFGDLEEDSGEEDPYSHSLIMTRFDQKQRLGYAVERYVPEAEIDLYYVVDLALQYRKPLRVTMLVMLCLFVFLLLFVLYVYYLRCDLALSRNNRRITEEVVHYRSLAVAATGIALVLCSSYYANTLFGLSSHIMDDQDTISLIRSRYQDSLTRVSDLTDEYNQEYLEDAQMIARYLERFPQRRTPQELKRISGIFDLDWIMLFDQQGKETVSDGPYYDLEISFNENDPSSEFAPLKHGVDSVVQKAQPDALTGAYHQIIGVAMRTLSGSPDGFLQIVFVPSRLDRAVESASLSTILDQSIISGQDHFFLINPNDKTFLYSPGHKLDGKSITSYGFNDKNTSPTYTGYITVNGTRYFMTAAHMDDIYLYLGIPLTEVFPRRNWSVVLTAILLTLDLIILQLLLRNVRIPEAQSETDVIEAEQRLESLNVRELPKDKKAREAGILLSPADRLKKLFRRWKHLCAEEKIGILFRGFLVLFAFAACLAMIFHDKVFGQHSIFLYILGGTWPRGINVFALTASVILCVMVFFAVHFSRILLDHLTLILSSQGKTICRLLYSFIEYLSILITIYASLSFFGMDVQSLLASAGILTIVVGLGARDLIMDVINGLVIIFEGQFKVGDIVRIGTFTGRVQEIGIRTTKIVSWDDNVKIINNRNVTGVVNLSVNNSYARVEFTLPASADPEKVSTVMESELPRLAGKYDTMPAAPQYRGIISLNGKQMRCQVSAEVKEKDREAVEAVLFREIQDILARHEIPLG